VEGANDFIFFAAKALAQAGSVVRAFVLHRVNPFVGAGYAYFFAPQFENNKCVELYIILKIRLVFKYFNPMIDIFDLSFLISGF
jgi:hypothetical protein